MQSIRHMKRQDARPILIKRIICGRCMNMKRDSKVVNIFEDRLADVWICQMEKYRDYDKFVKCGEVLPC